MRIANLDGRLVIVTGDTGHDIAYDVEKNSGGQFRADPQAVYDEWDAFTAWASAARYQDGAAFRPEALRSPVPAPRQVFGIGLNYRDHAAESGYDAPVGEPPVFTKFPSCITGPSGEIDLPPGGHVDWEVELVAVIGRRAYRVPADQALNYVAGYAVGQDVSERVLQLAATPPQFSLGKSLPGFGPIGPWLVTLDEIADPNDLELGCEVNGEPVQLSRTSKLIFSVPELIANLSASTPLLPGDVIFTGTPSGVGLGRTPPRWLAPGDVLTSHIEALGSMRHQFVAAREGKDLAMPLHRLTQIVMGVPNVEQTAGYYTEFGLTPAAENTFATVDGGEQLRIVPSSRRRLVRLGIGADDPDDLGRVAAALAAMDVAAERTDTSVTAIDPGTEVAVRVEIAARYEQQPAIAPVYNAPGAVDRIDERAPGVLRDQPVRPRKLGHVVLGSTDKEFSQKFFTHGLGFKVSDTVPGIAAFLRCSTDHHNVLVQQAPVPFLHHTSWQVDDVDEVGRGASAMLEADPSRHTWGLGRHFIGSNFFWYLKDPAGSFSEYYSDLDCIVDDALWQPGVWEGARSLWAWGPPPPPSFLLPEDLAALMTGAHQTP